MVRYVARLCWNTLGWRRPTGDAAKSEKDTYATRFGFGHEEWLFDFHYLLDGWKYGFLQPVNRSYKKVRGATIGVELFTIDPRRDRYYVGRLDRCEVLTEEQASSALLRLRKCGALNAMKTDVRDVGGKIEGLEYKKAELILNVRFRPDDVELFDPIVPVGVRDPVFRLKRYSLVPLKKGKDGNALPWRTRTGTTAPRTSAPRRKKGMAATIVDPVEARLQEGLFKALGSLVGAKQVVMEEGFVDIAVRDGRRVHLFEVKSDPRPRHAIRQAVGQLLEYAFARKRTGETVGHLIVAAPGDLDAEAERYIQHLRSERGLPLHYLCIRDMSALRLPWQPRSPRPQSAQRRDAAKG